MRSQERHALVLERGKDSGPPQCQCSLQALTSLSWPPLGVHLLSMPQEAHGWFVRMQADGWHPFKFCEQQVSDQTLLNYAFKNSWNPLPSQYNFPTKPVIADLSYVPRHIVLGGQAPVLHFAGDHKPWGGPHAGQTYYREPWRTFHNLWHQACNSTS